MLGAPSLAAASEAHAAAEGAAAAVAELGEGEAPPPHATSRVDSRVTSAAKVNRGERMLNVPPLGGAPMPRGLAA
jgi:hypothetical protein